MSDKQKKVFRLLHGGDVDVNPTQKILKKGDHLALMDAKELLEKVQGDAKLFKQEITGELEQERELARKQGFAQGLQEWTAHLKELQEEKERVYRELEKMVVPIAIKAAKKIVGRETSLSEGVISEIVANNLRAVSQHKQIKIFVNPSEKETLEKDRERLRQVFERLESLTIEGRDDIQPGGCVIETEVGIINAELENQWQQLERAMMQLIERSRKDS